MNRDLAAALFVFISSFIIFSANIGGLSIYSLDEAKNAECAREMLERADLIVPTFNYQLRTDKPPLHYYFMMISYSIFGVNEFSARFFSSLFGAFTVLITFLISHRYLGYRVAFFSFIALISSLHFSIQFHMAVPDPFLIFWINAALFSFLIGFKEDKKLFIYLFYIFMGLGVLTKGPVAVVLPSGIILLYLLFTGNTSIKTLKKLRIPSGLIVTALVSLPWYIAVYIKTDGKWVYDFIFKHNIHRFSEPMEGHGGIFIVTLLFIFFGMLPFSVFIPQTLKLAWKNRKESIILLSLIIVGVYTIFFSISGTKLPNYTVPLYPALAILTGYFLDNIFRFSNRSLYISLSFYTIIGLILTAGLFIGIRNEPEISDLSYLSLYFLLLPLSGILAIFMLRKSRIIPVLTVSAFSVFLGFLFFYYLFPKIDKRNPVYQMMPLIEKDRDIRYYKNFNPAFVFYLKKEIKPLKKDEIQGFLHSDEKVYILTRKRYLNELKGIKDLVILKQVKDLFERKISVLITNRKD
ncbi:MULTISPECIES: glycosyltransferase family 39 protein [Persephonella]|uniref:Putative dolichyl-phosphate-mannose-protein mannosyltransferase family protein n=1 Tax=Persephonella marina (strain DSM 14350 / EX-H1) TaxID=123214 RepID=C0QUD6_PERMH|nr:MULTISPECIES: glycosyltransferase family 39 protein [Persephonella]ACO04252.1 putative dolichyl-phosphate-mannose-protein mannosyltransferase family protein [Persephonella marina EX-H1]